MPWSASAPRLPKLSRTAWVSVEMGFHPAKARSADGSRSAGTKVLAMKVNGKMMMKDALPTTSGVRTFSPTHAITQLIA